MTPSSATIMLGNSAGAADEIADKAIQIVDQPLLVGDDGAGIGLLQLDAAPMLAMKAWALSARPSNTRTRSRSVSLHLGASATACPGQRPQHLQLLGNVLERDALQFGAPAQRLHENAERGLDCFAPSESR